MPIIKSAIKQMRQNRTRQARLKPVRSYMKTMMRKIVDLTKENKHAEAMKILPDVFKAIDMAAKKRLIHRKNADRKKSLMSRMVATK